MEQMHNLTQLAIVQLKGKRVFDGLFEEIKEAVAYDKALLSDRIEFLKKGIKNVTKLLKQSDDMFKQVMDEINPEKEKFSQN